MAARGPDGRAYPWGNSWDPNRLRDSENRGGRTTVGVWRYGQGGAPFGGLQFSGNVWEWCADWYDSDAYARYRQGSLAAPLSGKSRVVRGWSWCDGRDHSGYFSASFRFPNGFPDMRYDLGGLRCVVLLGASP